MIESRRTPSINPDIKEQITFRYNGWLYRITYYVGEQPPKLEQQTGQSSIWKARWQTMQMKFKRRKLVLQAAEQHRHPSRAMG